METLSVQIEGVAPLLMHSGRTKDPTDPMTKEIKKITSKRNKTDDDFQALKELELIAGLYADEEGKIYVPDLNIERSIYEGAKQDKNGKKFLSAFMVRDHGFLKNGSQYMVDKVAADPKYYFTTSVNVQRNSVMRTRPRFNMWNLAFECSYNPSILNEGEVTNAIEKAGQLVGLGDWRPKFGRFRVIDIQK